MEECKNIEFKEKMTDSFLKTVSAYANYGSGTVYFGITDDGTEIGIENPKKFCLDMENKINDNIHPKPDFSISANKKTNIISLHIQEGEDKPYTFRGKAYRRSGTSTVEVDRIALNRLILEGSGKNFEELPSKNRTCIFRHLHSFFLNGQEFPKSILTY